MQSVVTLFFPLLNFQKNVPYLFDQLDLNHDGVIDYNEQRIIYKIFGCSDENSRVSKMKIMTLIVLYSSNSYQKYNLKWHVMHANKLHS